MWPSLRDQRLGSRPEPGALGVTQAGVWHVLRQGGLGGLCRQQQEWDWVGALEGLGGLAGEAAALESCSGASPRGGDRVGHSTVAWKTSRACPHIPPLPGAGGGRVGASGAHSERLPAMPCVRPPRPGQGCLCPGDQPVPLLFLEVALEEHPSPSGTLYHMILWI